MVRFLFNFSPNAAASGTVKPGGMYRKQIQKVHIVFSSIDKRTATASPLLRYYVKKYIIYTKMLIYSLLCKYFFSLQTAISSYFRKKSYLCNLN